MVPCLAVDAADSSLTFDDAVAVDKHCIVLVVVVFRVSQMLQQSIAHPLDWLFPVALKQLVVDAVVAVVEFEIVYDQFQET